MRPYSSYLLSLSVIMMMMMSKAMVANIYSTSFLLSYFKSFVILSLFYLLKLSPIHKVHIAFSEEVRHFSFFCIQLLYLKSKFPVYMFEGGVFQEENRNFAWHISDIVFIE